MAGSKKGRTLRPYRTGPATPVLVTFLTPEQLAEDAFEALPGTAELLGMPVDAIGNPLPSRTAARTFSPMTSAPLTIDLRDLPQRQRVQVALTKANITQAQVAQDAGVSEGTVSKVLAGTFPDATDVGRATRERVQFVVAHLLRPHLAEVAAGLTEEALVGLLFDTAPPPAAEAAPAVH